MIKQFYVDQIEEGASLDLDLSKIICIGGESIVLKTDYIHGTEEQVVKVAPVSQSASQSVGIKFNKLGISADARKSKERSKIPELIPNQFEDKNIIKYSKQIFIKVGKKLYLLTGNIVLDLG